MNCEMPAAEIESRLDDIDRITDPESRKLEVMQLRLL